VRRRGSAVVGVLLVMVAGCGPTGPEVQGTMPSASSEPSSATASGPCRPPLGPDEESPLGQADGQHPAFAEGDWWGRVGERVQPGGLEGTAGMWLDQVAGELVVMITADDPQPILDELRELAGPDHADRVVCMVATHSEAELRDLQRQAHDRLMELGVPASSSVDTVRNRVEVSHEGAPDEVEDALGDLADHPALTVARPACADVVEPPADAVLLPGGGSTCGGMDALLTGTLVGEPDTGCLWVESEGGGEREAIAWPRGWWVTPDGVVHDHRGEPRARVGEVVNAGGGHVPDADLPDACRVGDGAFLLNALDPA
jgi:hypothetical protein